MKLTLKHIEYLKKEIDFNNRTIQYARPEELITLIARRESLRLIAELVRIKD